MKSGQAVCDPSTPTSGMFRTLQKGYETQGPYQDCGMTGEVAIVDYE